MENEIVGACSTHGREVKFCIKFLGRKLKRKTSLEIVKSE
jgi:hypothetical protein